MLIACIGVAFRLLRGHDTQYTELFGLPSRTFFPYIL
jgi:hypothetical protein